MSGWSFEVREMQGIRKNNPTSPTKVGVMEGQSKVSRRGHLSARLAAGLEIA
jgi:hypothetical protein